MLNERALRRFRHTRSLFAGVLAVTWAVSGANAATLNVPAQYPTIQDAINAAVNGDDVLVANGTYSGVGNIDLDFLGKAITVHSANGAANCIIDCSGAGRGFYLHTGEGPASVIDGFTIRNGDGGADGGAIFCEGTGPAITGCVFETNTAWNGGAISVTLGGTPAINSCTFVGNTADTGGGIGVYTGSVAINTCTFDQNVATYWGGGVVINWGTATMRHNDFAGNTAPQGGAAAFVFDTTVDLHDSAFNHNSASFMGGGIFMRHADVSIYNASFERNTAPDGGAIALMNPYSSTPAFLTGTLCTFSNNFVTGGGGAVSVMYGASITLSQCDFFSNSAQVIGGAIDFSSTGGHFVTNSRFGLNTAPRGGATSHLGDAFLGVNAYPVYVNCTFSGNVARYGSALHNDVTSARVLDCTIANNRSSAGTVYNVSASAGIGNSIVWANSGGGLVGPSFTVTYTDVQGGFVGAGNINANPLFVDDLGPDLTAGTADDNLRLTSLSPCIDAGNNTLIPADLADLDNDANTTEPTPLDLDLMTRIVNGIVNMGAYERY